VKIFLFLVLSLIILNTNSFATNFTISTANTKYNNIKAKNILNNYLNKINFDLKSKREINFFLSTKEEIKTKVPFIFNKINKFKNDGFIIELVDNTIYIVGVNKRSLIYGIYSFLERSLNCKFLSSTFEIIPEKTNLIEKNINFTSEARFNYREIFIKELEDINFASKLGLNGEFGHKTKNIKSSFIKTYNNFTPFELIPLRYKDLYPEYFCNGQLDFTSNKVKEYASLNFNKKVKNIKLKDEDILYIAHEDILSYCNNRNSKNLINKYASTSAPFLDYSNYIAKNIYKKNKNTKVFMEAYQWSRKAPSSFPPLSKNLNIFFSDIEANFAKSLAEPENRHIYKDLQSWQKYERDIYIWHYITNFNGYLQPFPNIISSAKDIKLYSKLTQVNGVFLQGAYETTNANQSNLRAWVLSKLMWNPKLDEKRLIKEFTYYYYSDAYEEVLKYFKLLNDSVKNTKSKLEVKTLINSEYLNEEFIKEAKKILDKALKKVAKNSIYFKHLRDLYSGIDYVQLLRGTISDNDKIRFKTFLEKNNVKYYAEGSKVESLKPYFNIKREKPKKPKLLENTNKVWIDFQEYQLKLCCSQIVYDKKASSKSAVRIEGNKSDWGIQLDLKNIPKGKWDIYVNIRIKKTKNLSKLKYIKPAIYYGVHKREIKNLTLINTLKNEDYKEIKIAQLNIKENDEGMVWIRPPESKDIEYVYVDRLFVVKNN
jgi:hypothetical protein